MAERTFRTMGDGLSGNRSPNRSGIRMDNSIRRKIQRRSRLRKNSLSFMGYSSVPR